MDVKEKKGRNKVIQRNGKAEERLEHVAAKRKDRRKAKEKTRKRGGTPRTKTS